MTDPTNAQLDTMVRELQDQLRPVKDQTAKHQELLDQIKPNMTFITVLKATTVTLGATVLIGLISFAVTWGMIITKIGDIAELRKDLKEVAAENRRTIERLEDKIDRLDRVNVGMLVVEGKFVAVKDDILDLINTEGRQERYTLSPDVRVRINGKEAKLSDLKKGDRVRLARAPGSNVTSIDAEREP